MADVYEIRHANLLRLVEEYGSIAEINEAMGPCLLSKTKLSAAVANQDKSEPPWREQLRKA